MGYPFIANFIAPFGFNFCSALYFASGYAFGASIVPRRSYSAYSSNPFVNYRPFNYLGWNTNYYSYVPTYQYTNSGANLSTNLFQYTQSNVGTPANTRRCCGNLNSQGVDGVVTPPQDRVVRGRERRLNKASDGYGLPFLNKVKEVAAEINCDYRDLLAVMNSESGIDSSRPCSVPGSSAVGLIQFTEAAATTLGTTTAQLRNMTPIEQLEYVKKYYMFWRRVKHYPASQKLTAGELYALTFTPAYVRADSDVLVRLGSKEYNKNKVLDTNRDGLITKSELAARVENHRVSDNSFIA